MRERHTATVLAGAFKQVNKGLLGGGEDRKLINIEKVGGAVFLFDLFAAQQRLLNRGNDELAKDRGLFAAELRQVHIKDTRPCAVDSFMEGEGRGGEDRR